MLRSPRLIFTLFFALSVVLAASSGVASAQDPKGPGIDLSVDVDATGYQHMNDMGGWRIRATNHGSDTAFDVIVRVELSEEQELDGYEGWEVIGNDPITLLWRVGKLEGGSSVVWSLGARLAPGVEPLGAFPAVLAVPARGVISNSFPVEPEYLLYNNADEGWLAANPEWSRGRASIGRTVFPEMTLDNPTPQDGDTVVLGVKVAIGCPNLSLCRGYGFRVRVQLPPGLGSPTSELKTGADPSTFTPVSGQAGQWDWVTEYVAVSSISMSLSVPVVDSAALRGECVTAELTVERPADDPSDNLARVCFQEDPRVLFTTGETDLFTLYPCVGVSDYPCTGEDTLEVVVRGGSAAKNAGIARIDPIMRPDDVVIQITDPGGEQL